MRTGYRQDVAAQARPPEASQRCGVIQPIGACCRPTDTTEGHHSEKLPTEGRPYNTEGHQEKLPTEGSSYNTEGHQEELPT